jgi:hypothetical protein
MTFQVALETLEGHQRAIMGSMTVEVSTNLFHRKMLQCLERIVFVGGLEFGAMVLLTVQFNLYVFRT